MKILPVPMIREADAFTVSHEPITGLDLMERAASACCAWLKDHITNNQRIMIFCGSGNNGGDGFAIARLLSADGYKVEVFSLSPAEKMSASCRINFERLPAPGAVMITDSTRLPVISDTDILIDAIFGNGLTRPAEGLATSVFHHMNTSGATIIAIDVPSGLFCDATSQATPSHHIIRADHTLTFSPPKLAFFFPENENFVGEWHLTDIGLSDIFIESVKVDNFMIEAADASSILKKRTKFAHKGTFGHALIIAGATGKTGAAVLAAKACIRSGPGLVTLHIPGSGIQIMQTAVPEVMISIDRDTDQFSETPDISPYSAIAVGPGIGTGIQTCTALKILIQHANIPVVFDADAINILAENRTWLGFLPKGCIFTPHPKEFERLAGKSSNNFERNKMQREFSFRHQCYVVLKGAHTAVTTPDGRCYFNTTGNPGMATGGSGDVLTGIITGLMAQGYTSLESCLLGVYIHGLAGDIALGEQGFEALVAGDIVSNLGNSFQTLYGKL